MNYKNIFHSNFEGTNELLLLLAKRNSQKLNNWCAYVVPPKPHKVICYICNKCFDEIEEDVWFHGYQHLKEHNLLLFL